MDDRKLKRPNTGELGVRWTQVEGPIYRPTAGGAVCQTEAEAVARELQDLLVKRRFQGTVGIVTPFRAQANRIRDLVNEWLDLARQETCDLIVDTAHGFQGDERDVVFFSPCVGPDLPDGAKRFLSGTGNLFNVAVTRARSVLHVVGNQECCANCAISHIEAFSRYVGNLAVRERQDYTKDVRWDDPPVGHWEKVFYEALLRAGIKVMPQYPVHQYRLDFAVVEGDVLLDIEVDGERYHRDWDGNHCHEDVLRDRRLIALGWTVKRFWVYRIRDEMDQCIREVRQILDEAKRK